MNKKDTNPKDACASNRAPLGLIPDTALVAASVAFREGAIKYGSFNWREAGVSASVYNDAMRRHIAKWFNGENADPETGVHHLASVIASAAILLDALAIGKLNDDRPPKADIGAQCKEAERQIEHLKNQMFKAQQAQNKALGPLSSVVRAFEQEQAARFAESGYGVLGAACLSDTQLGQLQAAVGKLAKAQRDAAHTGACLPCDMCGYVTEHHAADCPATTTLQR